jgi:hypothetical protein
MINLKKEECRKLKGLNNFKNITMETKWLSIQSFQRSQNLLDIINRYLIHLKLSAKGIDDKQTKEEIKDAENKIKLFIEKLDNLVKIESKKTDPLTGLDIRYRKLIRNFVEAKSKKSRFKSSLFKGSPNKVLELIISNNSEDKKELINSLTELRTLLEDHISVDLKELIGDI